MALSIPLQQRWMFLLTNVGYWAVVGLLLSGGYEAPLERASGQLCSCYSVSPVNRQHIRDE